VVDVGNNVFTFVIFFFFTFFSDIYISLDTFSSVNVSPDTRIRLFLFFRTKTCVQSIWIRINHARHALRYFDRVLDYENHFTKYVCQLLLLLLLSSSSSSSLLLSAALLPGVYHHLVSRVMQSMFVLTRANRS
jgi:hypothetical protein